MTNPTPRLLKCPRDTDGDGNCGNKNCPDCGGDGSKLLRLLSKAERDELRRCWANKFIVPQLCDTADHWEAEAAKWEGIISQIGCEVTHYRLDHHAESSMKAIDKIFGFPIPEHSEVTRLRGVLVNLKAEYKAADA
jgi:hypothetical protein